MKFYLFSLQCKLFCAFETRLHRFSLFRAESQYFVLKHKQLLCLCMFLNWKFSFLRCKIIKRCMNIQRWRARCFTMSRLPLQLWRSSFSCTRSKGRSHETSLSVSSQLSNKDARDDMPDHRLFSPFSHHHLPITIFILRFSTKWKADKKKNHKSHEIPSRHRVAHLSTGGEEKSK